MYQFLADIVLALHTGLVFFVILGLPLILLGNLRKWRWVNSLWFRLAHLATIGIVVGESWLGFTCPLTTWEQWLRNKANISTYSGSFIQHWLSAVLFWDAPAWVFTTAYTLFGLAVVGAWLCWPPRLRREAQR